MQLKLHMVTIEDLMPQEHFLRQLENTLDLSFVYAETAHLYSRRYGRPPIDPVILVKYLLVGYLYGILSERQIEQRIQTDVALRWYLGLDLLDAVPDHSTISQLRRRKPAFRKVFRQLFERVVRQCIEKGLASGRLVGTDSTHVKANASRASEELVEMPVEPGAYWERLDQYEEAGLEELAERTGKRRKTRTRQLKRDTRRSHKRVSRTDPEAGHMKRPSKPEGQYYLSHQTVDCDRGVILDVTVTPGDVHDSVPYLEHLERIHRNVLPIQTATADAAYDFPLAHQVLAEQGILFYVRPQSAADRTKAELKRDVFVYDETCNAYRCPNGKEMQRKGLYRSASGLFWEYWADKKDCAVCPLRGKCLSESDKRGARKLLDSYFRTAVRRDLARRNEPEYLDALRQRQIWCEGTFAAQKWRNNLTRTLRRGLEAAEDHCLLSATALNLKRMIRAIG
jgi:transposase